MVYVNSVKIDESIIYLTLNDVFYNPRVIISPSDATCPYVEWSTSHPDVVSVDPHSGNIRALKTGTAIVHATAADGGGATAHITVRVQEGAVTNVDVIESHLVLPINGSGLLHLDLTPSTATYADITWESTQPNVASVTNGVVCANSLGSTIIYARATGSYSIFDTCYVTVTSVENPVTSITLNHLYATKPVNTTFSLIATVTPSNATNNRIEWASSNPNVATVDQNGCVTTKREGGTTITASSTDGGGVVAHCSVQVIPVPVTGIELSEEEVIMDIGETKNLVAYVKPPQASNKMVTWCSGDERVATVELYNGIVTAKKTGNTTITACTLEGNYVDSCNVKVKEIVIINKDGNYSNVVFSDGKIWKCNLYIYNSTLEYYEPIDIQRANYNASVDFSEKQLGFLFKVDPKGVIYYVMNKRFEENTPTTDYLIYRDNIFKEIYGKLPRYFVMEDSQLYFCSNINENNRYDVYSEAELIFGILPRWTWQNVTKILIEAVLSIASIYVPQIGIAMLTCDVITAFFFTEAIGGAVNAVAAEFISKSIEDDYGPKMAKRFGWAITIVNLIPDLLESALPPEIDEAQIAVYENAYHNKSYTIKISDNNQTVDLNELIEHYKNLIPQ